MAIRNKVLALEADGSLSFCSAPPEKRGQRRCHHIAHQEPNESLEEFNIRANKILESKRNKDKMLIEKSKVITQEEIDSYAKQIDQIAGEKITSSNFKEVISKLPPEKIAAIASIGFNAAPEFSLPIKDEEYENESIKNKLYFTGLAEAGIGGNQASIAQMFEKVGRTNMLGENYDVEHSYKEGLNPEEYFARQFVSRDSMINKGVATAKPGYSILHSQEVYVYREIGGSNE